MSEKAGGIIWKSPRIYNALSKTGIFPWSVVCKQGFISSSFVSVMLMLMTMRTTAKKVYTRGFRISWHIPEMGQMSSFVIQLISSIPGRCVSNLSFSAWGWGYIHACVSACGWARWLRPWSSSHRASSQRKYMKPLISHTYLENSMYEFKQRVNETGFLDDPTNMVAQ